MNRAEFSVWRFGVPSIQQLSTPVSTRFEEGDGGVYIEVEAIALSRDIPGALQWFVEPIVRRVSRSSVATALQQTGYCYGLGTSATKAV